MNLTIIIIIINYLQHFIVKIKIASELYNKIKKIKFYFSI